MAAISNSVGCATGTRVPGLQGGQTVNQRRATLLGTPSISDVGAIPEDRMEVIRHEGESLNVDGHHPREEP